MEYVVTDETKKNVYKKLIRIGSTEKSEEDYVEGIVLLRLFSRKFTWGHHHMLAGKQVQFLDLVHLAPY